MADTSSALSQRIQRAKELLGAVRHIAVATVNEDGSPHNSPLFAGFGDEPVVVWSSHPQSAHSRNIERTGQAFIVVFDSMQQGGGLYIQATASLVTPQDMPAALRVFNEALERLGRPIVSTEFFEGEQKLYMARPQHLWVNMAVRDQRGKIVRDNRYEVAAEDLRGWL